MDEAEIDYLADQWGRMRDDGRFIEKAGFIYRDLPQDGYNRWRSARIAMEQVGWLKPKLIEDASPVDQFAAEYDEIMTIQEIVNGKIKI